MKRLSLCKSVLLAVMIVSANLLFASCEPDNSRLPVFESAIVMNEDLEIVDWRHCGEETADGKYYYQGKVTLFSKEGYSNTFPCFVGLQGFDNACRFAYCNGTFYNIERNEWVSINGVTYRGARIDKW